MVLLRAARAMHFANMCICVFVLYSQERKRLLSTKTNTNSQKCYQTLSRYGDCELYNWETPMMKVKESKQTAYHFRAFSFVLFHHLSSS